MATAATLPPSSGGSQGYLRVDIDVPHDRQIEDRNRVERLLVLLGSAAIVGGGPFALGMFIGWTIYAPILVGFPLGVLLAAWPMKKLLERSFMLNDQQQAFVSQDILRKTPVSYGPGLSVANWWESRSQKGNTPLEPIDREFSIDVPTLTARVTLNVFFQWRPDIRRLGSFLAVKDESTLDGVFEPFLQSFLTDLLSGKTAAEVRGNHTEINQALADQFMGAKNAQGDSPTDLEEKYGVTVTAIQIKGIVLPPDVQRTLDGLDEAIRLNGIVANLLAIPPQELVDRMKPGGDITQERFAELLVRAMAISGNATFNVNQIDLPGVFNRIQNLPGVGRP